MPDDHLPQRQANLARLRKSLAPHCMPDVARTEDANRVANQMPLNHATGQGNLQKILASGALLSQVEGKRSLHKAEIILGTTDDVFLYVGAFSYPDTECGFLFLPTVEKNYSEQGISTPFDSGALVSKKGVTPPAPYSGNEIGFVRAHELPVSEYRSLLGKVIAGYSRDGEAYLHSPDAFACPCGVEQSHPFGLSGGDWRAATFEVRIPKRVPLQHPHLRAVFVRRGFEVPELSALFSAGVTIERYDPGTGADSLCAMREACISFIQEHLLP